MKTCGSHTSSRITCIVAPWAGVVCAIALTFFCACRTPTVGALHIAQAPSFHRVCLIAWATPQRALLLEHHGPPATSILLHDVTLERTAAQPQAYRSRTMHNTQLDGMQLSTLTQLDQRIDQGCDALRQAIRTSALWDSLLKQGYQWPVIFAPEQLRVTLETHGSGDTHDTAPKRVTFSVEVDEDEIVMSDTVLLRLPGASQILRARWLAHHDDVIATEAQSTLQGDAHHHLVGLEVDYEGTVPVTETFLFRLPQQGDDPADKAP